MLLIYEVKHEAMAVVIYLYIYCIIFYSNQITIMAGRIGFDAPNVFFPIWSIKNIHTLKQRRRRGGYKKVYSIRNWGKAQKFNVLIKQLISPHR